MSLSSVSAVSANATAAVRALSMHETSDAAAARPGQKKASPDEIKRAASQFEAIILRQLLSPSIEPMMNGGMAGGKSGAGSGGGGVYGYMLTDVLADSLSKGGGLGLSSMLTRQLTPRGVPAAPKADAPAE